MEFQRTEPWWTTDSYVHDSTLLHTNAGPKGVATVKAFPDGRTQAGWGLTGKDGAPGFMENYLKGKFNQRLTDHRYTNRGEPFAYVMRSVQAICIDVDGKNGGFESMPALGHLPPTLAETSKSGTGIHLFYRTDEPWDDELGFALFDDRIGLATGIDVRATGCVYHHSTQRWNHRVIAPLPEYLATKLREAKERRAQQRAVLDDMEEMDMDDVLVMQDSLIAELNKPIPSGKRNNTLFAIGTQLKLGKVEGWEELLETRALAVGLSANEAEKLVTNVATYGV